MRIYKLGPYWWVYITVPHSDNMEENGQAITAFFIFYLYF